jgi:type II restriction enzyme
MLLRCDISSAPGYKSPAQISRVLSESWFRENGYCMACESDRLWQTPTNTKAADFTCRVCNERYELKTFCSKPPKALVDGAYGALMSLIESGSAPTLMLLERTEEWWITGLTAVHHMFLTPSVIQKRNPLSHTARRAGWVGCNIRLDRMAPDAQIPVISGGVPVDPKAVRTRFHYFDRLKAIPLKGRDWTALTLRLVRALGRSEFSLSEIYSKEWEFSLAYPGNKNIRAKIRQQLQVLRDLGYLEFLGQAMYRLRI